MIRVSEEAKRLLGTLWAPDGEVLRLILHSPGADGPGRLTFRHGRGEGADQIVQHGGRQVLRIDPSVRSGFDGSSVEAIDGALGVVPPGRGPKMLGMDAGDSKAMGARAQELGVALVVREEPAAVGREEREPLTEQNAANLSLEAQG